MPKKNPAIDGDVYLDVHSIRETKTVDGKLFPSKASTSKKRKRMRTTGTLDVEDRLFQGCKRSGGIDGFRRFRMGFLVFFLRGSRRITKNFKVLLQNCKSLPASSCGTLCFCVFSMCCFLIWNESQLSNLAAPRL